MGCIRQIPVPASLICSRRRSRSCCCFGFSFRNHSLIAGHLFQRVNVQVDSNPFSVVFVIQGHGKTADVDDSHPLVPSGAGSQNLHRIRETGGRFANNVEDRTWRQVPAAQVHHEAGDQHAAGDRTMEILDLFRNTVQTYMVTIAVVGNSQRFTSCATLSFVIVSSVGLK